MGLIRRIERMERRLMRSVKARKAAHAAILAFLPICPPQTAWAQDTPPAARSTERIRIYAGPEIGPAYPGAKDTSLSPFFDFSRARGDEEFAYEAPDEGFGIPVISANGIYLGPVLGFTAKRGVNDTALGIAPVKATVEAGLSLQADIGDHLYGFTEIRRGIGGHDGWVIGAGLDYILRDHDKWLVSIGPRLEWGNRRHQRAYFGVTPEESSIAGVEAYSPGSGIQSLGGTLGVLYQLSPDWGLAAYGRYDRLAGDAADSPITENFGRRNQYSAGIALSYTFTRQQR